jgi:hypothetical protein
VESDLRCYKEVLNGIKKSESNQFYIRRIWSSHSGEYEDGCLWVVAPCSMVEVCQRFRGPCCLHHQGDRKDLWNVGKLLSDYTALQPRRQPSTLFFFQEDDKVFKY